MKVFGDSTSGNCLKVKWLLSRLGVEHDWLEIDVMSGATRTPEFLAQNPSGQVPLVVFEDGRALAQSNAILLHLGEGSEFVPACAYDRAKMYEWLFWEQYSHEPYVAVARFQVRYLGRSPADLEPRLVERGKAALARLDQQTAAGGFLVGQRLTLADIALVAYTRVAHEGGFDLSDYPWLNDWIDRVEAELGL